MISRLRGTPCSRADTLRSPYRHGCEQDIWGIWEFFKRRPGLGVVPGTKETCLNLVSRAAMARGKDVMAGGGFLGGREKVEAREAREGRVDSARTPDGPSWV